MLKIFQFQEDTEAHLFTDLKRTITYVKFVLYIMHCVLLFEWKDSLSLNHPTQLFLY